MRVSVRNRCSDFSSYRAARVKSLFNAESGCNFDLDADLDIEGADWKIGIIVGPSGSGKTSMGKEILGGSFYAPVWPDNAPIVDAILPAGDFNDVTAALAAVGLGSVPAWLRPYNALSNGEKFRATLARLVAEAPAEAVVDEFTSVVDRQIAKIGALAFSKSWRRTKGRVVLLTCHYDILDWVQPDWVFDTGKSEFHARWLQPRPRIDLDIWEADWSYWKIFKPHHYLDLGPMHSATCYVGTVDGELVAHLGMGTRAGLKEARACRLVIMPEWQGAGVGVRFLNEVCAMWLRGDNRHSKRMTTLFHTSHPGLCAALRRDEKNWSQVSAVMYGASKARSGMSIARSAALRGTSRGGAGSASGYGGHMRAVQGFRYGGRKVTD